LAPRVRAVSPTRGSTDCVADKVKAVIKGVAKTH